jgi:2-oxo-4-hydroxy-4-carboxy-5-ureidoimidazoline decarboxylase
VVTVAAFNELDRAAAFELLLSCCASTVWAESVAAGRPFDDLAALLESADAQWEALPAAERQRAIEAHPPIGGLAGAGERERREQAGAAGADESTREALAALNEEYRERFGFVFLTDASGRDAADMLSELRARLANTLEQERAGAEHQQRRIVRRRLRRTIVDVEPLLVSTHVLDTASGAPATGVKVSFSESGDQREWTVVETRATEAAGRIEAVEVPRSGWVRLVFGTADYARRSGAPVFFADVVVTFAAGERPRAHVPLLLSPFGYSTYLGT